MFDEEFNHLEPRLRRKLEEMLEGTIREISSRYGLSRRDYSIRPLTGEEINARIRGIFDLARNFRPVPGSDDT